MEMRKNYILILTVSVSVMYYSCFFLSKEVSGEKTKNLKTSQTNVSKALNHAERFSKEHAKGLKFSGAGKDCNGMPTTKLESSDAIFEIEPEHLKCFHFLLKGDAVKRIAKKGAMNKSDAKDIALKAVKNFHTDFVKRKMVFGEKSTATIGVAKDGKEILYPPTNYVFWWTEHVQIGKYDVAVPGNAVYVLVDAKRHIIVMLHSLFKVNLKNVSLKPITIDESEAKNIALSYMKSKFNFAMDKLTIKGPSMYSAEMKNRHIPFSIYWQITAEGIEPKTGIMIGASLEIDATTGQIAYFSGGY